MLQILHPRLVARQRTRRSAILYTVYIKASALRVASWRMLHFYDLQDEILSPI